MRKEVFKKASGSAGQLYEKINTYCTPYSKIDSWLVDLKMQRKNMCLDCKIGEGSLGDGFLDSKGTNHEENF